MLRLKHAATRSSRQSAALLLAEDPEKLIANRARVDRAVDDTGPFVATVLNALGPGAA